MFTDFKSIVRQKIPQEFSRLYSKLMPTPCTLCGTVFSDDVICQGCRHSLPSLAICCPQCATPMEYATSCGQCLLHPPAFDESTALYLYESPIDRLISQMKYHDKLYLCNFFAEQFYNKVKHKSRPEMIIPIPLHPRRLRSRGYNQSWEIAKTLSKKLNIPASHDTLIRVKETKPQATLPLHQRKKNMQRAFSINQKPVAKHIALIDDVVTTGHTANMAAKELRKAGAVHIELWTIARAIRHD
jgi:ComF family protein